MELEELGRAALAVLDGGLFMGMRVVELAAAYLEQAREQSNVADGDSDDEASDG